MTELEKAVADSLRLSDAAAEKLLHTIQRNILAARAELIRSGCRADLAKSNHPLVEDAITAFCLHKMDDEGMAERHWSAFQYQQDNLRKSTIKGAPYEE